MAFCSLFSPDYRRNLTGDVTVSGKTASKKLSQDCLKVVCRFNHSQSHLSPKNVRRSHPTSLKTFSQNSRRKWSCHTWITTCVKFLFSCFCSLHQVCHRDSERVTRVEGNMKKKFWWKLNSHLTDSSEKFETTFFTRCSGFNNALLHKPSRTSSHGISTACGITALTSIVARIAVCIKKKPAFAGKS